MPLPAPSTFYGLWSSFLVILIPDHVTGLSEVEEALDLSSLLFFLHKGEKA
jgi:hypothetical protein